eukprot:TRINITY_DN7911_c0_g1_i2.p1 TRINITY_DN7911_c0_g1~~TRINITY_DN7911_c0_g1_i2.p1  ORF type:complete len:131 (+),score=20.62 TRINITY_DN7911_c0_g1_i2:57-449(+)
MAERKRKVTSVSLQISGDTYTKRVTEKISVLISQKNGPDIHIVNLYRPPLNGGDDTRTEDFTAEDLHDGDNVLTVGDINLHHKTWSAHMTEDAGGTKINDWIAERGRVVWNNPDEATRVMKAQRSSPFNK